MSSGGRLLLERTATVDEAAFRVGAQIWVSYTSATATISGGDIVVSSGGMARQSIGLSGSGAGLGVSTTVESGGWTQITVTSAGSADVRAAADPARLAHALASFVPDGGTALASGGGSQTSSLFLGELSRPR